MQTFMPCPNFRDSLRSLDNKRLGKQRVEAQQILNTLEDRSTGWRNHPAVKMWKGYEEALKVYINLAIGEWQRRGFNNSMSMHEIDLSQMKYPHWMGDDRFHASHRANLLRKDYKFYSAYGWTDDPAMAYFWPKGETECKE